MKILTLLVAFIITLNANAQKTTTKVTDSFMVNGNCSMCKKTIEKAALQAGAATANWNETTLTLQVTYVATKTSVQKIQQLIAKKGYDNAGATSTDAAYNKLHGCCKYERKKI